MTEIEIGYPSEFGTELFRKTHYGVTTNPNSRGAGFQLHCFRTGENRFEVWCVPVDGGPVECLLICGTRDHAIDFTAIWGPDGKSE